MRIADAQMFEHGAGSGDARWSRRDLAGPRSSGPPAQRPRLVRPRAPTLGPLFGVTTRASAADSPGSVMQPPSPNHQTHTFLERE